MNKRYKILGYMEICGETIVVLAAASWITHTQWIPYAFAAGTILFSIGRLAQGSDEILAETPQQNRLNMKRLIRQRNIGIFMLYISSAFMFVRQLMHVYQDIYLFPSSWLIPFLCFVVIEAYTAFRMPYLLKDTDIKTK